MTTRPTASAQIADYVLRVDAAALTPDRIHTVARAFLDTVGVALAGQHEPASQLALAYGRSQGRGAAWEGTVWATGEQLPLEEAALVNGTMGHVLDYDDLMSGVDAVIAKGYVDPTHLFVTGGSGGGVLTAWIVGKTDRFRAAAVQKPVINWTSFALTADGTNFFSQYWFPAKPWEKQEDYWRRSPLSLVGNVKTPTMVVSGELDNRTPISEAEQYFTALKLRKVDTLLVRVPGAPHSLDQRPSQLAARIQYILAWFGKW